MRERQLSFNHEQLVIDGYNNFHIKKVEVFTGNDDYQETDSIEVVSKGDRLEAKQLLTKTVKPSSERIRFEPGVRLHLELEGTEEILILSLCHHKGCVVGRVVEG